MDSNSNSDPDNPWMTFSADIFADFDAEPVTTTSNPQWRGRRERRDLDLTQNTVQSQEQDLGEEDVDIGRVLRERNGDDDSDTASSGDFSVSSSHRRSSLNRNVSQDEDGDDKENGRSSSPLPRNEQSEDLSEVITTPESDDEFSEDEDDDDFDLDIDDLIQRLDNDNDEIEDEEEGVEDQSQTNSVVLNTGNGVTPSPITAQDTWNWTPSPNHKAKLEDFDDPLSGITWAPPANAKELDYFEVTFSEEARNYCVEETNRFSDQEGIVRTKRYVRWTDLSLPEFMKFIAIRMLMGVNKKPEMRHYWSRDPLLQDPLIPKIMPQDRFFEILKFLHLCNNEEQVEGDRLFKIRHVWDLCMATFASLVVPGRDLSVDESLVLHKGRVIFKQFISNKASKFGIKTFTTVDELTKMILNSLIYSGKTTDLTYCQQKFGYGGAIVLQLTTPYLNKNRRIYCDNWFTSPTLAKELLDKKTRLCGTLRKNRKNLPQPPKKMKKGEVVVYSSNEVMVEFWKDKRIVRMISTIHDHGMKEVVRKGNQENIEKPLSVLDYNKHARGIDQADMSIHFNALLRKTKKWYKKLFFHLVDLCLYNAFRMFLYYNPTQKKRSFLEFRLQIIRQILEKYGIKDKAIIGTTANDSFLRLNGSHFPQLNSPVKNKKHASRKCRVCAAKKTRKVKETVYSCDNCKVPLCIVPCFKLYHTRKNYA